MESNASEIRQSETSRVWNHLYHVGWLKTPGKGQEMAASGDCMRQPRNTLLIVCAVTVAIWTVALYSGLAIINHKKPQASEWTGGLLTKDEMSYMQKHGVVFSTEAMGANYGKD